MTKEKILKEMNIFCGLRSNRNTHWALDIRLFSLFIKSCYIENSNVRSEADTDSDLDMGIVKLRIGTRLL